MTPRSGTRRHPIAGRQALACAGPRHATTPRPGGGRGGATATGQDGGRSIPWQGRRARGGRQPVWRPMGGDGHEDAPGTAIDRPPRGRIRAPVGPEPGSADVEDAAVARDLGSGLRLRRGGGGRGAGDQQCSGGGECNQGLLHVGNLSVESVRGRRGAVVQCQPARAGVEHRCRSTVGGKVTLTWCGPYGWPMGNSRHSRDRIRHGMYRSCRTTRNGLKPPSTSESAR